MLQAEKKATTEDTKGTLDATQKTHTSGASNKVMNIEVCDIS